MASLKLGIIPEDKPVRMTITLPAEMAAVIKSAVETGDYASSSEVVREAVGALEQRRQALLMRGGHVLVARSEADRSQRLGKGAGE